MEKNAGYDYCNSFVNSVFCVLTTVNLLLSTPECVKCVCVCVYVYIYIFVP